MLKKIINSGLLTCFFFCFLSFDQRDSFKNTQLKCQRVKNAYASKWSSLRSQLKMHRINENDFDIYLRVFKEEGVLEIFVKNTGEEAFQLFKTFPVCAKSGSLGPKRKEGDRQVPEGFYTISAFNPYSDYHLALKVGYPNKSDLIKSGKTPGGDIMIHGNCVTIGCIPLRDDPVEELYLLCLEAKNRKRLIRADLFPFRFNETTSQLAGRSVDPEMIRFWNSLKKGYLYFEKNLEIPEITVDKFGNYDVKAHN